MSDARDRINQQFVDTAEAVRPYYEELFLNPLNDAASAGHHIVKNGDRLLPGAFILETSSGDNGLGVVKFIADARTRKGAFQGTAMLLAVFDESCESVDRLALARREGLVEQNPNDLTVQVVEHAAMVLEVAARAIERYSSSSVPRLA